MDFIGPLPRSNGFNAIFIVIDRFSSMVHLIPTTTNADAEEVAKLFFNNIYRLHGLPLSIVSDRDTRFTSHFWKQLMEHLGIRQDMSTAYHPQTDGSTERANRTIIQILRNFTNTRQSDWSSHLPRVEFAINFAPSESTGTSPFETNSGNQPIPLPDFPSPVSLNPHADNFVRHMTRMHQAVFTNIMKSRSKQKEQADKRRRQSPPYKIGDQVLVSSEVLLPKTSVRSKLSSRFQGPFTVTGVASHDTFDLDLPKDWSVHRRFHTSVLKPYHNNDNTLFPSRSHERPPPVQAEHTSEPQYEVEEI